VRQSSAGGDGDLSATALARYRERFPAYLDADDFTLSV